MEITPRQTARVASAPPPDVPQKKAYHGGREHEPSLPRDLFEKAGGAVSALGRIPTAVISGAAIGGYTGYRKATDADYRPEAKPITPALLAAEGIQGVLKGALLGYGLLGPAGAALSGVKELGQSSVGLYLFVKGGSAEEMGTLLAEAVDSKVTSEHSAAGGAVRGAAAGSVTNAKNGARTAYMEGRAAASGTLEGFGQIPREVREFRSVEAKGWKGAGVKLAAAMGAALAAPPGVALGVLDSLEETTAPVSRGKRLTALIGANAVLGAAAGFMMGGPVGSAVGGAVGAVSGIVPGHHRKGLAEGVAESLERTRSGASDLGHEIANKRRDLISSVIVGGASGARQGWNAVAKSMDKAASAERS